MKNVLLSCAGRRVELLRILQDTLAGLSVDGVVVATDASPFAPAFVLSGSGEIVPRADHPDFIPAMLDICRRREIRWVIPTIDTELPVLSAARGLFADIGTDVVVSNPETIAIAADKRETHAWFVRNGFPTFRQVSPVEALDDPAWGYPCFVKPARGSRSVGAVRITGRDMLAARVESGDHDDDVVESLGHGFEITADAYISPVTGRCECVVPRRRLEVRDGEVSKAKTVMIPEVMDMVTRVAEALPGARGPICVQMFYDPARRSIELMEINPRFGGGYPLSEAAGAGFAARYLADTLGIPSGVSTECAWDLVMLRYDMSVFLRG